MKRHRGGIRPPSDEDSSSDEDGGFFTRSSSKRKKKNNPLTSSTTTTTTKDTSATGISNNNTKTTFSNSQQNNNNIEDDSKQKQIQSSSETSSNKRHHFHSSSRAAKMDALLQELQDHSSSANNNNNNGNDNSHHIDHLNDNNNNNYPEKMGSFVMPGEELHTTNIFVGNLSPITTEEELTDVFRTFGDLYSVKIMWPRTAEERARGRNTGFVCFMNREDAQEAMDAFQEKDPLNTGRRMCLRWGKNVKKTVKRGTGGVPIPPIRKRVSSGGGSGNNASVAISDSNNSLENNHTSRTTGDQDISITSTRVDVHSQNDDKPNEDSYVPRQSINPQAQTNHNEDNTPTHQIKPLKSAKKIELPKYDPSIHSSTAIHVYAPTDPSKLKLITTVASFVAKDGSLLEKKILEHESNNPYFSFLHPTPSNTEDSTLQQERIFYRWRVYAFAQGDGFDSWRTEPFVMFEPNGRFWIPPFLDLERARREEMEALKKEEIIRFQQEERRKIALEKKDVFMTGRQMEQAKFSALATTAGDGAIQLNEQEMKEWMDIMENKLCSSKESICHAMSFCFDKSGAAKQISELLRKSLIDDRRGVSVETRIARLYLLSDVLFNSQQPGVKGAFLYRDAIERMAPEVFKTLGQHGYGSTVGRMTLNKLRNAVSAVLAAWTHWSVYNSTFLDELEALFEGKPKQESSKHDDIVNTDEVFPEGVGNANDNPEALQKTDRGVDYSDEIHVHEQIEDSAETMQTENVPRSEWTDAGELEKDDNDGVGIDEQDDEEEHAPDEEIDGELLEDDDLDGEMIEEDDVDGEPLDEDDDLDGDSLDEDDYQ